MGVLRLLAAAHHEAGEWQKESRVRAALLEATARAVQWPTRTSGSPKAQEEGEDDEERRLLLFQHASSYVALQCSLYQSASHNSLRSVLECAASDANPLWRANARALLAIATQPSDDTARSKQATELQHALDMMEQANQLQQQHSHPPHPPPPPPSPAGCPSPLVHLLHVGDLHCLLADYHRSRGDEQRARKHYEHSQQYWAKQRSPDAHQHPHSSSPPPHPPPPPPSFAVPLMRGGLQLAEVWPLCGLGLSSRAVQLTEQQLGPSHPQLAVSLRLAAVQQQAEGEAIVAEGLLRSSIAQLDAHISQPAATMALHVSPADLRVELLNSQWQYAQLLNRLEWNGRSRQVEAEHWTRKIEDMTARHAYLKPHWQHLQQQQQQAQTASNTTMPRWLIERLSI